MQVAATARSGQRCLVSHTPPVPLRAVQRALLKCVNGILPLPPASLCCGLPVTTGVSLVPTQGRSEVPESSRPRNNLESMVREVVEEHLSFLPPERCSQPPRHPHGLHPAHQCTCIDLLLFPSYLGSTRLLRVAYFVSSRGP